MRLSSPKPFTLFKNNQVGNWGFGIPAAYQGENHISGGCSCFFVCFHIFLFKEGKEGKKERAFKVSMTSEAFFVGACKMGVLFLLRFLVTLFSLGFKQTQGSPLRQSRYLSLEEILRAMCPL